MQKQNMTFIFFVAFLLIFFVCYLFVIGEQKEVDIDKKTTESTKKFKKKNWEIAILRKCIICY